MARSVAGLGAALVLLVSAVAMRLPPAGGLRRGWLLVSSSSPPSNYLAGHVFYVEIAAVKDIA